MLNQIFKLIMTSLTSCSTTRYARSSNR